jgi:hypothetical protein
MTANNNKKSPSMLDAFDLTDTIVLDSMASVAENRRKELPQANATVAKILTVKQQAQPQRAYALG